MSVQEDVIVGFVCVGRRLFCRALVCVLEIEKLFERQHARPDVVSFLGAQRGAP